MTIFARSKTKEISIRPMRTSDIEEVRSVGQESWTDLAMRDIGKRLKYPKRSEKIIDAYMYKEPNGCLVVEEKNRIIGSAFCHVWGRVGWIGPIEVLPEHQDAGVGKALLKECERYLDDKGCQIIGLETLPTIIKNIHFYMTSGYSAKIITLICEKQMRRKEFLATSVEPVKQDDLYRVLPEISDLSTRINPYLDYSPECEMVVRKELGDLLVYRDKGRMEGFSLTNTYHRGSEMDYASIKLLAVNPDYSRGSKAFHQLLDEGERRAADNGKTRMLARYSAVDSILYREMALSGYVLKASNLRMIKRGKYEEDGAYNLASWAG